MDEPLSAFVKESHTTQKGERVSLKMRKEQGSAMKRLAEIMNGIDLSKHQKED
jgi:hypothetical protein